jgi:hypothetical protein
MSTYSASCREDIFTARSTKGSEATIRVKYLGYHEQPVTARNSRYDRFLPVANGWGTIHPILDKDPPLRDEEEGPSTCK